jgi:hypothetical protein
MSSATEGLLGEDKLLALDPQLPIPNKLVERIDHHLNRQRLENRIDTVSK